MSLNYSFVVELARSHSPPPGRLLDFGCGAADVALRAQEAGFEAHAADTFLGVGDSAENFEIAQQRIGERARRIVPGQPMPFADAYFDVVVSNQVFEHVEDLPSVIAELARVTRSGGLLLALMPTSEVLWEDHLHMPFVHRLANGSVSQRYVMRGFRWLGFGTNRDLVADTWIDGAVADLRDNIRHRSVAEYFSAFAPAFRLTEEAEPSWARDRIARHRLLRHGAPLVGGSLFDAPLRAAVRRAAGAILVLTRTQEGLAPP